MNHILPCTILIFYLISSVAPVRLPFLSTIHLPRPFASSKEGSRTPNEVLEICWGDRGLTISPRALPTLIDYFRVCTNAVYVLSPEEEPRMLTTLRNKIFNSLPDVNKAYLYSAIPYDQVSGLETALHNVEKVMDEKNISPTHQSTASRWLTINTNDSSTLTAELSNLSRVTNTSDNPCKDLVVLDGVDKTTNASLKFIPTPYQDDPRHPQYMAIPFSKHFLYDIRHKDSVNVLKNYYRLSVRCLATFNEKDVERFRESLYDVIVGKILPVIRSDPFRIVPAYGGVLEILGDLTASIGNATEVQSASNQQSGLTNIHFKKLTRAGKRVKSGATPDRDLVWAYNYNPDVSNYYQSLLLLLSAVCLLNCLCYLTTFLFYFVIRRKQPKSNRSSRSTILRSQQGLAGSKCSMWTRPKEMDEEDVCCHGNQEEAPFTSCLIQEEIDAENNQAVQHIKCPHNIISPRPQVQPTVPKKYYRVGDFSLFKPRAQSRPAKSPRPLMNCDLAYGTREDEEAAQSIQGSEEFQRIMRELDEVHRSIQTVFPRIHGETREGNAKYNNYDTMGRAGTENARERQEETG